MEQDLRASLKALLQDQNLPADLCEAALEQFLDEFTKTRDILKASWHIAARLEQPFNRGPVPPISSKYVRVAKFVPLNDFIIHHLTLPRFGFSPSSDIFRIGRKMLDDEYVLNSLYQRSREDLIRTRNGVNWTTLDSEVTKPDPQILFDELGWNYLEPTEIVRISYDIATRHLHVPTVLDAQMVPWFVPHPRSASELPRAWNWVKDKWGLPEFVHPAAVRIENPQIDVIGHSTSDRTGMNRLASFDHIHSRELENVVSEILTKATAHLELRAFISGSTDLLTLTPREFEIFIGHLYQRTGFKTEVTQASRDGGFDVIAISDSNGQNGLLIQAKHTRGVVGIRVIRELFGARLLAEESLQKYMLVVCTTGRFSRPAVEAESKFSFELELVDYDNLQQKLRGFREIGVKDIVKDALNFLRSADPS